MTSLSRDVEPFREVFRRAFERAISKVLRHEGACVCILAGLRLCMPCCPAYGPWGASMDNGASACSRLVLVSEKTRTPLHRAVTAFSNLFSVYASVSDTHSRCCPGRSGVPTQVTCARANTYISSIVDLYIVDLYINVVDLYIVVDRRSIYIYYIVVDRESIVVDRRSISSSIVDL